MWFSPEAFCENHIGFQDDPKLKRWERFKSIMKPARNWRMKYPPRETITYRTLGRRKIIFKSALGEDIPNESQNTKIMPKDVFIPGYHLQIPSLVFQTMPTVNDKKKKLSLLATKSRVTRTFFRAMSHGSVPPPSLRNAEVTPETLSHQGSRRPDLRIYLNLQ